MEVYNQKSSRRFEALAECFAPDVSLCLLKSGATVVKGVQALTASMPADYAKHTARVTRRLFITTSLPSEDPSFSMDFYPAGQGPGINAFGKGNVKLDTILVFEVKSDGRNVINQVWIAPDRDGIASRREDQGVVTELSVLSSKAFPQVAAVLQGRVKGKISYHMHDYLHMATIS